MPSKRTSNAAKRNSRNAASAQAAGLTPLQNDIIGVVLAVVAIAMFCPLLSLLTLLLPARWVMDSNFALVREHFFFPLQYLSLL